MQSKLAKLKHLALLIFAVLLSLSLIRSLARARQAKLQVSEVQEEVDKVSQENKELKEKLDEASSSFFAEEQLRDGLGMAKEGEIVLVMPDAEILRQLAPSSTEEENVLPDPNWKKWMKLFMSRYRM